MARNTDSLIARHSSVTALTKISESPLALICSIELLANEPPQTTHYCANAEAKQRR